MYLVIKYFIHQSVEKIIGNHDYIAGERALKSLLDDAMKVADRCAHQQDREEIVRGVQDIKSMMGALSELRQQGKGNSPQALSLARAIQDRIRAMNEQVNKAVVNTERSGIRKPAHTLQGKTEQALRWANNPSYDDKGLGKWKFQYNV